jgi:hypothetical protein
MAPTSVNGWESAREHIVIRCNWHGEEHAKQALEEKREALR